MTFKSTVGGWGGGGEKVSYTTKNPDFKTLVKWISHMLGEFWHKVSLRVHGDYNVYIF